VKSNPLQVGGKAANLERLRLLRLPVPRFFVLPVDRYRAHLRAAAIEPSVAATPGPPVEPPAPCDGADTAAAIRRTPLSAALKREIAACFTQEQLRWPVAVRSSAVAEDAAGVSFAGQFASVLQVASQAELERAILHVWASAWSPHCLGYARAHGRMPGDMAVIVQCQIHAACSGVLFTCDPLRATETPLDQGDAVLEWVSGLGDVLVSGAADPHRLRITAQGRVVDASREHATPAPPVQNQPWFDTLIAVGRRLERRWGCPQDIEWTVDAAGALWLLQSRPITVKAIEVWTNANVAENFPGPLSPFLFSIVRRGYAQYFRQLGLGFGISRKRVAAMSDRLERLVGLHGGRLYYNLTNIHAVIGLAPAGRQLASWFNTFTGAREFPAVPAVALGWVERIVERVRIAGCIVARYWRVGRQVARFEATVDRYAQATRTDVLARLTPAQLTARLAGFLDIRFNRWNDAALADTAAMVCYGLLGRLLKAPALRDEPGLLHHLLKGLPDLASARPVQALWLLSRWVLEDSALARHLRDTPADVLAAQYQAGELGTFGERFRAYLNQWGFRYSRELMLDSPTPEENPAPMLHLLQSYLQAQGVDPVRSSQVQARERLAATARACERLTPNRWWRAWPLSRAGRLRIVLHATQASIGHRERARMKQALLYTRLRHLLLACGRVLHQADRITRPDDVYFISHEELAALLEGRGSGQALARRIADARREQAAHATLCAPDVLELPAGATWTPSMAQPSAADGTGAQTLYGISACGGSFAGPAVVVEDVSGIGTIRPGEILVTRQTDPGWAAVFFMVKGLVIERGGMLSHGAIIAREYGIPAVIGVRGATTQIRSGQSIHVNGDQGVVRLTAA
jgi:rifampicin phosphotransferase